MKVAVEILLELEQQTKIDENENLCRLKKLRMLMTNQTLRGT